MYLMEACFIVITAVDFMLHRNSRGTERFKLTKLVRRLSGCVKNLY